MKRLLSSIQVLGFVIAFAILAALSTVLIWALLSLFTAEPFAIDAMGFWPMTVGAIGPVLILLVVRRATRATATSRQRRLRITSAIGAITVLIIEIVYLVVLGMVYLAYDGVRM